MAHCAIVGINWGDEGKGRMVDYLAESYDVVIRYQGGNNAGHTVVNELGEFKLNLLPSGIFRPEKINLLGAGTVIDLKHLCEEMERVRAGGVTITPENLKISNRAMMVLPFHPLQDKLEEKRLGKDSYGSTLRGISPIYGDKYMKKALQMGDLLHPEALKKHLKKLIDWKNAVFSQAYGQPPISFEETMDWINTYGGKLIPHIVDAGELLETAQDAGKNFLFEAQLGALRDIDYGIYPFTSASTTLAAYAPIGSGIPFAHIDRSIGIMKAYSSCVGEGPFPCELFGEPGEALRAAGGEYGAATGRPRRVGGFDVVASRYGVRMQGCDCIALTKLDVLSYLERIPVCVAYELRGERIEYFPSDIDDQNALKPVYEYRPGFMADISACRRFEELPAQAQSYIRFIEAAVGCPIQYVSVGAEREAYIRLF